MTDEIRWENNGWHYLVHRQLGEVLFYYLARIRPFKPDRTIEQIRTFINERKLGSVRVFPIFGPYDLLIRAWLHPSLETEFREWLEQRLDSCRTVKPFAVKSIDYKWYPLNVDRELLVSLNDKNVRAVQNNEAPELLRKLIEGNLVIDRKVQADANNIKFFVAIKVEDESQAAHSDIIKGLREFISEYQLHFPSIYSGWGYCSMLIKGQANDFFDVAKLPNRIAREYAQFGISTETYLAHTTTQIFGNENIGEGTFNAIEGRNLFIQSIIPELYESNSDIRPEIDRFLREIEHNEANARDLSQRDKRILHDYFYGLLNKDYTQMAQSLFIYFYALETFLRDSHKDFIARALKTGPEVGDLYKAINAQKEGGKFLTLGDLIRIYRLTISRADLPEDGPYLEKWQELVQIRNHIAHGEIDFSKEWEETVRTLVRQLAPVRKLISLVEKVTDKQYTSYYG